MQSLLGLLLLLIIIYAAYLISSPDPKVPDVEEVLDESVELLNTVVGDIPDPVPPPEIKEGAVAYQKEALPDESIHEEEEYGFFSGTMEYLTSALSSYKDLLASESARKGSDKGSQDFGSEEDSSEALLIYRDMLDIQSKAGARRD